MTKYPYYIIWIEGICWKTGEKVKSFSKYDYDITTKMGDALRIKKQDKDEATLVLSMMGVADWALTNAFISTSYAPKGTLHTFE